MKLFLEADFTKGSGALRWEGVTSRRLRRILGSVLTFIAATALIVMPRL
ncbi:MAG: hypothetical protein I8H71_02115 [Xanthomonadaceae bacterium]|nr:hypothetical protein [Xanthomonadaceae bacterium]